MTGNEQLEENIAKIRMEQLSDGHVNFNEYMHVFRTEYEQSHADKEFSLYTGHESPKGSALLNQDRGEDELTRKVVTQLVKRVYRK
mmetsp:Transcript_21614/g.48156  ORF Transcript_21614/g.48156 Transcript_21614/m.48156 type:complete len:86 (+) Transcript_21614:654-911(+)